MPFHSHSVKLHRRFTFVAHAPPQGWSTDTLEDYDQYHFRYLSVGCHKLTQENHQFFDRCCHPRLKSQNLEKIPVQCQLDPSSLLKAQDYILKSTDNRGAITSGVGTPIYVTNDSIQVMKPSKGRSPTDPPTSAQLTAVLKAQAEVNNFTAQNQSNISPSTSSASANTFTQNDPKTPNLNTSVSEDASANLSVQAAPTIKAVVAADPNTEKRNTSTVNATSTTQHVAGTAKLTQDLVVDQTHPTAAAPNNQADNAGHKNDAEYGAPQKAADHASTQKDTPSNPSSSAQSTSGSGSPNNSGSSNYGRSSNIVSTLAGVVSQVYGSDGDSKGTFFYQEGAAGACGTVNSDSTPLVALPTALYGNGQYCGKEVMIKNTANGKTVVAKVQDMCPGCPSATSLDLSTGAYDAIGAQSTGVLPIEWGFM
ncbi:hypothetical protein CROQUDRAFT_36760 [Cronartium quercuum f. sp. fusiforme G11]|uniref:Expansin-like EG45 domain-containing protein n=1 Tax=Cronartium quercuum f. sp. fusiforme G11 TaxID=708437 RepID=A0A9P6NQE0_9BASI|nr:hypothetical protein CROQUDRAFT_36760 [Cronartium quercuum f. sp. fusiforme G11]